MKKIYTTLFVLCVMFSNYTYSFAADKNIVHFPKVSGTVCFDGTVYQTTYTVTAWDGESTAVKSEVLATSGDTIVYSDTISIPITKTFYTDEAPDYIQVEAGEWNDGYTGGISGGGLGWSNDCPGTTADADTSEPLHLDSATLFLSDFILTKEGAKAYKNQYGNDPVTKSGCSFATFGGQEGDFYEFRCVGISENVVVSNCVWSQNDDILVSEVKENEQSVALSITFLRDFDRNDEFLFSCGIFATTDSGVATAAAAANSFVTQRELDIFKSLKLLWLPGVFKLQEVQSGPRREHKDVENARD